MTKSLCRLFVVFASEVPAAVVIWRSSAWFHLIRWETKRDTFSHGAWMRGKIFPGKCDLSPDGHLFLYSVSAKPRDAGYPAIWTAVSRAPWLHALVLWPQDSSFGGGGRFVDDRALSLRGGLRAPLPQHSLKGLTILNGATPLHRSTGEIPKADWSGRDQRGNLIYTIGGKLIRRTKRQGDIELADFSKLLPDPQPAPDWARKKL